ncbi:plant UBX domain-containing protein 10-like [Capsicum annuum]
MRTIVLSPTDDQLFASSSLDGVVNLWQVQDRGSCANLLSSTDCFTRKYRRWPEDVAWHPEGGSLFSVYSADDGDSQISIMNLNKEKENMRVNFLEEKPHVKGIINNIMFMPWEEGCFVTGGSDHAVVLWTDKDGEQSWKPKELHRGHSSAVMGVAGLQHKKVVMSAGADKRILGIPGLMPIPFSVLLANLQTAAHLTPASSPNVDGPKFPEEYLVVPQRANEESALVLVTTRVEAEERRKHPGADHAALEADQAGKRRRIEGKECPEREAPSVKIEKLLSLGPEPEKGSDVTQEIEKVLPSVPPPEPKYQLHRTSSPLLASSFMYK